jgi:hypothetical protein
MKAGVRALALTLAVWAIAPAPVAAQTIGTFRWQVQPYCNLITVVVTQVGSVYTLEGTDDQCGATQRASVTGTAFQNPDGTIGLGFNVVAAPGGAPGHIDATITLPAASGTWRDSQGNSGSFVLTSNGRHQHRAGAGSAEQRRHRRVAERHHPGHPLTLQRRC